MVHVGLAYELESNYEEFSAILKEFEEKRLERIQKVIDGKNSSK